MWMKFRFEMDELIAPCIFLMRKAKKQKKKQKPGLMKDSTEGGLRTGAKEPIV